MPRLDVKFTLPMSSIDLATVPENCSDGDVRLAPGYGAGNDGRVEVCINQAWGSICYATVNSFEANTWDSAEAIVVCRQLGFLELGYFDIRAINSYYGGHFWG